MTPFGLVILINVFAGGLIEGYNYPKRKNPDDRPFFDLSGCNDIILVDRKFFLENIEIIKKWALKVDN